MLALILLLLYIYFVPPRYQAIAWKGKIYLYPFTIWPIFALPFCWLSIFVRSTIPNKTFAFQVDDSIRILKVQSFIFCRTRIRNSAGHVVDGILFIRGCSKITWKTLFFCILLIDRCCLCAEFPISYTRHFEHVMVKASLQ